MPMKNLFLLLTLLTPMSLAAQDYLTGQIIDHQNGEFSIDSVNGKYKIEASNEVLKSLASLANPVYVKQSNSLPYSYEFKGKLSSNNFELYQTPTNIPGDQSLVGVLKYDQALGKYLINDQIVEFGYTKVLNGYGFDEISKRSFIGKEIIADGHFESGVFIMQALTPKFLFSATNAPKAAYDDLFSKDPYKFMERTVYQNTISKSQNSFRRTFYQKKGHKVASGDSAFIITLSGRQGDSFGSVNGHFVAGLGSVKDDLSLRAEVSNAYVVNGKDILSGNTSLTNYFSNLVQGQNNYRPTYTLIVYGIDAEKLKKFRDYMEPSHIDFRTRDLEITLEFNCTTETAKGLSLAGIIPNHKRTLARRVFDLNNLALPLNIVRPFGEAAQALATTAAGDKEDFQPRPAFHSYLDSLKNSKVIKKLGITRMDYVFYAQTPSSRPVGGAPSNYTFNLGVKYDSLFYKKLYERYENNDNEDANLAPEQLRKKLKILDHIQ